MTRPARGFTLLEIVITIGITAIVVAGLTSALGSFAKSSASRRLTTRLQGEGRDGVTRVEARLRQASLGSMQGTVVTVTGAGVAARPAVQIFDNVPGGVPWLDVKPGTDALLVVGAVTGAQRWRAAVTGGPYFDAAGDAVGLTTLIDPETARTLAAGDTVLLGPFQTAAWARVKTAVPGPPVQVTLDVAGNVYPAGKLDTGSQVRIAAATLYYVSVNDELVLRVLAAPLAPQTAADLVGREVLATGIENLQVDCEIDGGGLGWFQGCPGTLAVGDPIQAESVASGLASPRLDTTAIPTLRTVVLSVVARSLTPARDQVGDPPIAVGNAPALDAGGGEAGGTYVRRAYRLTVGVRNTSLGVL